MNTNMRYCTIMADPPWWESGGGRIKRGADRHYALMKTPAIIEYMRTISFDENAHLYLWVTNSFLEDGMEVMRSLGFRYVTNLVWVKDRIGLGQYFRGQHELLLFGVKGRAPYKNESKAIPSVISAKRREHSRKPDEQYPIIEATSYGPMLEVFARSRRAGWDVMGNEAPTDEQQTLEIEDGIRQ